LALVSQKPLLRGRLPKEQELRLAKIAAEGPEGVAKAAKIRHYLLLKRAEERAKLQNPIAWYKPLPAALAFHKSLAKNRLCTGGNRSSKTYSGTCELIYWLMGQSPYREVPKDIDFVVSSESFDVQRNTIIETFMELMPKNGCINLAYNRDDKFATGPNGRVLFKSAEQGWRAFQGFELNGYWMDEEQDYEIRKQLSKRLKKGSIIQAWFTLTPEPDRPDHWTYDELAVPALEGNPAYAHFVYDLEDNRVSRGGHIPDSEIDLLIEATPIEERPAVIHGQYVKKGGLMYPMWKRTDHLAPETSVQSFLRGVQDGTYTPYCSLDWGVRNPTALLLICEDKDGNVHLVDEIYKPADDVTDIKRLFKQRFVVFQPIFVVADPSIWHNHDSQDHSRTIAGQLELDEKGLPGLPLLKADNDVTNGVAAVRDLLRVDPMKGAKLRVQPRCTNFIKEIENYVGDEWVSNPWARNKKETPRKQNDHAMDSFRYFALSPHGHIHLSWSNAPKYEYSEVGFMRQAV
jgi:terminase large subunit-like protein